MYNKAVTKSYRFRIYPNKEQIQSIVETIGSARFVYNYFLALRIDSYREGCGMIGWMDCSGLLTTLKKDERYSFLVTPNASALQNSIRDLETAYQNFFKRNKKGFGFPKFKSKRNTKQSFRINNMHVSSGGTIRFDGNLLRLPKIGMVKCRISKHVKGRIISATITRTHSDMYYVLLNCESVPIEPTPDNYKGHIPEEMGINTIDNRAILSKSEYSSNQSVSIGLDLGLSHFLIGSNGIKISNPKYYQKNQKKLAKLQRQLSRKQKGSNNYNKARIKVAKLHEHIANMRKDFLHKLSTYLVMNYDIICVENLKVSNMVKNRRLAKSISDVGWGEFIRQLVYKSDWYNKIVSVIDTFFPSSQLCSDCGHRNTETKNLSVRYWTCGNCGVIHDRDHNAAKNIESEGLRILTLI